MKTKVYVVYIYIYYKHEWFVLEKENQHILSNMKRTGNMKPRSKKKEAYEKARSDIPYPQGQKRGEEVLTF